ncbi:microsomal glutathione S-transferase 2-like [Mizuhopecten yessoensis]|uniref:Microsomal glutathione S-transferase 2 n=1 Tax=Mizuhopecten yessoensis TaxID=6573 RepID=A0A210Q8R9_MIZYE|nr:microsomal glutathione S-transferase 2-like [Mizuhopecten yessoensis]OWF45124.1 Microsomal glutathione S-transferase 2 [Mizuhopecten yessoensis]
MSTPIYVENVALLGIVTLAGGYQLASFAKRVGKKRYQVKLAYPAITGNPEFELIYRAQQNCLEFYPIFMSAFWTSGIFFHPAPTFLAGVVYLYAREKYFTGYSKSVEGRMSGFRWSVRGLMSLLAMGGVGLCHAVLKQYAGINVYEQYLQQYLKF